MHLVLRLPELCAAIFQHLNRPSLATAMRVCRTWQGPAISVLWANPYRLDDLWVLPPRRHLHEKAIRRIRLCHPEHDDSNYEGDGHRVDYMRDISTLLFGEHPGDAPGWAVNSPTLWRFPGLRWLAYNDCPLWDDDGVDSNDGGFLASLLERCGPNLSHVIVVNCHEAGCRERRAAATSAAAIANLARRSRLGILYCKVLLRRRDLYTVRTSVEHPFPILRSLDAVVASHGALHHLVTLLTTHRGSALGSLKLKLPFFNQQPLAHVLDPLGPSLRQLWLNLTARDDTTTTLTGADLRALSRLTQLRGLNVFCADGRASYWAAVDAECGDDDDNDGAGKITNPDVGEAYFPRPPSGGLAEAADADLLAIAAELPELEALRIRTDNLFSERVFAQVGLFCRKLKGLGLGAPLDLRTLKRKGEPIFPALENLRMDSAGAAHGIGAGDQLMLADRFSRTLRFHAPKLHYLDIWEPDAVDQLVIRVIRGTITSWVSNQPP